MPYLTAAVIVIGLVSVINLLLTMAVVRRLRQHEERLADRPNRPPYSQLGTVLPEFAAESANGSPVDRGFFTGLTLVGVFSTHCRACREQLPAFAAKAQERFKGHVLAIVAGAPKESADFAAALGSAATLITEPVGGPLSRAFQVKSVPTFFIVNEHAVIATVSGTVAGLEISVSGMEARL